MEKTDISETPRGRLALLVGEKKQEFAEQIGEDVQRLKDVLRGKQRMPEDMLVRLVEKTGVDLNWLIAGVGSGANIQMSAREARLLDLYRVATEDGRKAIDATAAALGASQPQDQVKQVFKAAVGTVQTVHEGSLHNHYKTAATKTRARKGG